MFSFGYPYNLLFLLAVPALALVYVWSRHRRRKALRLFGRPESLAPLMPDTSPYKPPLKITLQLLALTLIGVALARPWGGLKAEAGARQGIEVVIAMDASNSMLAPISDSNPGSQRLRTAKLMLEKLISRLEQDRVGLVVYAADAHQLIPITSDYMSARSFLNAIDPQQVSNQGTNIADAVEKSAAAFSTQKGVGRAIILITDAEDLEDADGARRAVQQAAKSGIQVDVIGVGSTTPVPIPTPYGEMVDDGGQPVRTALNEDLAASLASAGKGIYVNASSPDALAELQKQLDTLGKSTLEANVYALHEELFGIFIWIALGLLLIDTLILDRRISWLENITFFTKENIHSGLDRLKNKK